MMKREVKLIGIYVYEIKIDRFHCFNVTDIRTYLNIYYISVFRLDLSYK